MFLGSCPLTPVPYPLSPVPRVRLCLAGVGEGFHPLISEINY